MVIGIVGIVFILCLAAICIFDWWPPFPTALLLFAIGVVALGTELVLVLIMPHILNVKYTEYSQQHTDIMQEAEQTGSMNKLEADLVKERIKEFDDSMNEYAVYDNKLITWNAPNKDWDALKIDINGSEKQDSN